MPRKMRPYYQRRYRAPTFEGNMNYATRQMLDITAMGATTMIGIGMLGGIAGITGALKKS